MSLSSLYLDAFVQVAKQKSFSLAAKKLHITQSALSQRILNLEQELGTTLFIREPAGVRLTEIAQRLLRYCHSKEILEAEVLAGLKGTNSTDLSGILRIAGFSTFTQSILMPVVSKVVQKYPLIQLEIMNKELRNLSKVLISGEVDFIFSTHKVDKHGIENHLLGYEENVLIQSTQKTARKNVFLEHDEYDTTTFDFFQAQKHQLPSFQKTYLDDIFLIIEGVRCGLGLAVVPAHLIEKIQGIQIVKGYKPLRVPVYLIYYVQEFYTKLQQEAVACFKKEIPKRLF